MAYILDTSALLSLVTLTRENGVVDWIEENEGKIKPFVSPVSVGRVHFMIRTSSLSAEEQDTALLRLRRIARRLSGHMTGFDVLEAPLKCQEGREWGVILTTTRPPNEKVHEFLVDAKASANSWVLLQGRPKDGSPRSPAADIKTLAP